MIPTFDIESVSWTIPIAVGFYDGYNYHEFIRQDEKDDVIWRFLCFLKENFRGIKLYAHYAARFDNKFILSSLCNNDEVVVLEAGLLRLRWKDPNIYFEDSYPLLPMSLKRMTKMFRTDEKGEWAHEKGLKPWEMGEELGAFRAYLRNDCMSLSHSLYALCETLGYLFGITPSITLSTTSVKAFDKCFYDVDKIHPNEEFEDFIRAATYGGRNEVYKRYGENINLYDIKSMYVSCYDTPVPVGRMNWVKPNIDTGTLAEAFVKVPKDWYIGPLPCRIKGKLRFPVGEFKDWWDLNELRSAAQLGVDISIRRQLYCDELPVLEEFGRFVSKLRGTNEDELWKMFGIALSGKFGQSRWRDIIKHVSEIRDFEGYTPLDANELYFSTKGYTGRRAPYIRPAISMRIRSEARVRHLKVLLDALKEGDLYYSDTDSVATTAILPTGTDIGELTFLGMAERGYFIKQKLYGIILAGKLRQRSAGYSDLQLDEEDFIKLLRGEDILGEHSEFPTYRELIRGKDLDLIVRSRSIRGDESDSRLALGNETKPIFLPSAT